MSRSIHSTIVLRAGPWGTSHRELARTGDEGKCASLGLSRTTATTSQGEHAPEDLDAMSLRFPEGTVSSPSAKRAKTGADRPEVDTDTEGQPKRMSSQNSSVLRSSKERPVTHSVHPGRRVVSVRQSVRSHHRRRLVHAGERRFGSGRERRLTVGRVRLRGRSESRDRSTERERRVRWRQTGERRSDLGDRDEHRVGDRLRDYRAHG